MRAAGPDFLWPVLALALSSCARDTIEANPFLGPTPDLPMTTASESPHERPLLDLRAPPRHLETATFALG